MFKILIAGPGYVWSHGKNGRKWRTNYCKTSNIIRTFFTIKLLWKSGHAYYT